MVSKAVYNSKWQYAVLKRIQYHAIPHSIIAVTHSILPEYSDHCSSSVKWDLAHFAPLNLWSPHIKSARRTTNGYRQLAQLHLWDYIHALISELATLWTIDMHMSALLASGSRFPNMLTKFSYAFRHLDRRDAVSWVQLEHRQKQMVQRG